MCEEQSVAGAVSDDSLCCDIDPDFIIPQIDLLGIYQKTSLEKDAWNDSKRPTVRFYHCHNERMKRLEDEGILTDAMIASGSSFVERSAIENKYVRCKCVLTGKLLKNIDMIAYHHFLAYLDLSWNELEKLTPLGNLPCLMYLDVSHNHLTAGFDFNAPHNLITANFSFNQIRSYKNISTFWSLVDVDLSHNKITKIIKGVQKLRYLKHLDMSYNSLQLVQNLENLNLLSLNLAFNRIVSSAEQVEPESQNVEEEQKNGDDEKEVKTEDYDIDEMKVICEDDEEEEEAEEENSFSFRSLERLTYINLENNKISSLENFKGTISVEKINFSSNNIDNLSELLYLRDLRFLVNIDFRGNPICNTKTYFEAALNSMPHLRLLDGETVSVSSKASVNTKFKPDLESEAASRFRKLQILEQFVRPPINAFVPVTQPAPPIIVLIGLPGCRHREIATNFYENYESCFLRIAQTYTTKSEEKLTDLEETCKMRKLFETHVFGNAEISVSEEEFDMLVKTGKLITVSENMGFDIGISRDSMGEDLEKVMLICTDFVTALTLRFRGLRPLLVLAIPETEQIHRLWLEEERVKLESSREELRCPPCPPKKESDEECTCLEEDSNDDLNMDKKFFDFFCEDIIKQRMEYIEFHNENPGIIEEVIFTNKEKESSEKLYDLLLKCVELGKTGPKIYSIDKDDCYERMISHRMEILSKSFAN